MIRTRTRARPPEPTGSGRGWKEQLRRVAELALLGIVAVVFSLAVVTIGAVVSTLSAAVAHWIEHDELPSWSAMARELRRTFMPGLPVGPIGLLAGLVVVVQVQWLGTGIVPGGGPAIGALLLATGALLAVVLLAVPQLPGRGWRGALAAGWAALRRVPLAGAAVVGVTMIAVLLGVLLPGVAVVLPALLVLALHAVHRALVEPGATTTRRS